MKPIVLLLIAICVGIGYYAWRQQQQALNGLQTLKSTGVTVTFFLRSRPLLVVEASRRRIFLISGSDPQQPTRLAFDEISRIVFRETEWTDKDKSHSSRPDSLTIELYNGTTYRVGDLPGDNSGARRAMELFQQHSVMADKLILKARR